jgi:hypothetical protein
VTGFLIKHPKFIAGYIALSVSRFISAEDMKRYDINIDSQYLFTQFMNRLIVPIIFALTAGIITAFPLPVRASNRTLEIHHV